MNKHCKEFLEGIANCKDYWLNLDDKTVEEGCAFTGEKPLEYRMNGLIFSILVLIDGESGANNFKRYDLKYGRTLLNDNINLHDNVFKFLKGDNK